MNLFKKKYIVIYVSIDKGNSYYFHKKQKIKANTTDIKLDKNTAISINTSYPTYSKGLTSYFFLDIIDKKIKYFDKSLTPTLDGKYYNRLVKEKFFLDATSNLEKNQSKLISVFNFIFGVICGAPIGLTIGHIVLGGLFPLQI